MCIVHLLLMDIYLKVTDNYKTKINNSCKNEQKIAKISQNYRNIFFKFFLLFIIFFS